MGLLIKIVYKLHINSQFTEERIFFEHKALMAFSNVGKVKLGILICRDQAMSAKPKN